ncbi:PorV/PorQ family protein [candidate division KSB1 bacterium]|nr:PorV/PorQ family protein [candidate division KSB1 bacterium]
MILLGIIFGLLLITQSSVHAQKPYRVGTTAANFLEIGYGSAGSAMGDAYVSVTNDLASIYWNPAGLSYMDQSEFQVLYQPWIADISSSFTGVGLVLPSIGTFALSVIQVGYGDMEVTTMEYQAGTGELFTASDYAFNFSFGRRLAQWFAFGATGKYISSKIWHTSASAMAIDLGVIVKTQFFAPTGEREDGLSIGMSVSNYGTRMQYDGMDLLHPIDIAPLEEGNYRDVKGKFAMQEWELPLIFRIGFSVNPIIIGPHRFTVSVDALHPNNNAESVNMGVQYKLSVPTVGDFYLRSGYKSWYFNERLQKDSEFGFAFGGGTVLRLMNNTSLKIDYAYRGVGILGKTNCFTIGILF